MKFHILCAEYNRIDPYEKALPECFAIINMIALVSGKTHRNQILLLKSNMDPFKTPTKTNPLHQKQLNR